MTEGTAVRVNGTLGAGAGNGGPGTPCEGRYNPDELKIVDETMRTMGYA